MTARVQALGTAIPERVYKQDEIVESFFARLPGWEPDWAQVFEASGVERRASVVDVHRFYAGRPSTGERMRAFPTAARRLGAEAARRALERAGPRAAAEVGDLIVVSCTGYAGPGLDVHLAADLGLSQRVRRLALGHMGCHAALPALRTASALVDAFGERALVVCVELCSLHLQPATSRQEAVSQALFGDGAAAALIGGGPGGPGIVGARTVTLGGSEDRMGWLIGDHGFRMWLSPRVPAIVDRSVGGVVHELLDPHGLDPGEVDHWVVHPGGPEILDRVQRRLGLSDAQLAPSREVLLDGGNRSSATVLFILEAVVASGELRPGQWLVVLAFGTGLTMEALLLRV
ncbi:MAG TPA: type III polyketide synthase [Actinomycetes bacterium]|nr:type III polyketide synthase [Actinomycetes bacterium]